MVVFITGANNRCVEDRSTMKVSRMMMPQCQKLECVALT